MARFGDLGAPVRLAAFVLMLAVVGGVAALAGAATGNGGATRQGHESGAATHDGGATHETGSAEMAQSSTATPSRADGLSTVAGGYSLTLVSAKLARGDERTFRFRILDSDGHAMQHFDLDGGVRLHLIVVRRDFVGYQHLHPAPERDGSWSVPIKLSAPGVYRAFADFEVAGRKTVLGHDVFVPGRFTPQRLPPTSLFESTDEYSVRLTHGDLYAAREMELHFRVSHLGELVKTLEPYLGHRGHMVALRNGDLSYSHVHPLPSGAAGEIVFHTNLRSAGRYRLFLQFKLAGVVHTARFTVEVKQ